MHSHLEGKLVKYDNSTDIFTGKVLLIERGIGITIVDNEDSDNYLLCLIMPGSPKWKDVNGNIPRGEVLFDAIVKHIEAGEIDNDELTAIREEFATSHVLPGFGPTADSCAFA